VCGNGHAIIRKYGLNVCRQCFREYANAIGFIKVREGRSGGSASPMLMINQPCCRR
jgi:small subunit ribosomal protein S29e